MIPKHAKVTFASGAGTVTGANFLFEIGEKKYLVDCGLTQTAKYADSSNWEPFPYTPEEIDTLFVTHAHVDHIGRIPKLIHDGFRGRILSTTPTKEIAELMMKDTAYILSGDQEHNLAEIYSEKNIATALSNWQVVNYGEKVALPEEGELVFKDAGHILGSAMLHFHYGEKSIVFTGDLGNSPSPLLPDTEIITDATYMIMESVYGDRNHESRNERKKILERVLEDNYARKGTLIIPTFSLERSQELLYEINDFVENKRIPEMPLFFDSPLAIKLTALYQKYRSYFNKEAAAMIGKGDDIFSFPGLRVTLTTEESKEIFNAPNPKIIIAGSGMSMGGRIIHHEKHYLPDPNNTILLIGYQSMGTLGRKIEDGAKSVHIAGADVPVRAHVEKISGYSGHRDSDALVAFVENSADTLSKVFAVMGEPKSSMFLVQRLRDYLGVSASAPSAGESVVLEL